MDYVLGIDLGTSSLKGIVMNKSGEIISVSSVTYDLIHEKKGYSEQNPEEWVKAFEQVFMNLKNDIEDFTSNLKAISFSGQMHSLVLLDEMNHVIRPAILWNDTRNTDECAFITKNKGNLIQNKTKNKVLEGFTLPKILWVQNNEPNNWKKTKKILLPKDYLTFKLTGKFVMDITDAAGTLLCDLENNCWSDDIINEYKIKRSILPKIVQTGQYVGTFTKEYSDKFELNHKVLVFAGAADNVCSAIASGITTNDKAMLSIGTSGVLLSYEGEKIPEYNGDLHVFSYAVPKTYYSMGVTLTAGYSLKWIKNIFNPKENYDSFVQKAEDSIPGSNGLLFAPYLLGERTPHSDGYIRGSFIGLDSKHKQSDFINAVLEGVVFSLRESKEIMERLSERKINTIVSVGGGAKNNYWLQMQADILNAKIVTLNVEEGPGVGACMLAAVGCGWFKDIYECAEIFVSYNKCLMPKQENTLLYDEMFRMYQEIYYITHNLTKELLELSKKG